MSGKTGSRRQRGSPGSQSRPGEPAAGGRGNGSYCRLSNATAKRSASVRLEVADNPIARMCGLMFRDRIAPMLFVFGREGRHPIHSHFVIACFDAIYLSEKKIVVEIFRKIPPATTLVSPKRKARFLLELPPSLSGRLAIRVGDRLEWAAIRNDG